VAARAGRPAPLALLFAVTLAAGACGGAESDEGTQPAPGVTTVEQGLFDDIPRFPRSEPLAPRHEENAVVAQSFRAFGATPRGVLEHYVGSLPGWDLVEPITQTGTTDYRGRWVRGGWSLLVTAGPAPTTSDANQADIPEPHTQYSLTLSPA